MSFEILIQTFNEFNESIRDYLHHNTIIHQYKDHKIETYQSDITALEARLDTSAPVDLDPCNESPLQTENLPSAITAALQLETTDQIKKMQIDQERLIQEKQVMQDQLFKEMNKVDQMQMALEIAEKQKRTALSHQGLTPEQKQSIIRLEHESLKMNTVIERIDHLTEMLNSIITQPKKSSSP